MPLPQPRCVTDALDPIAHEPMDFNLESHTSDLRPQTLDLRLQTPDSWP